MMDDHKNAPAGSTESGAAGESGEEQALRVLLSGAVQDLRPSDGALDRLRHAVPARRARTRRRQVLVGAAAAAVLAGTAIPAAMRLTGAQGADAGHSAIAGHGQQQGGKLGAASDPHQNGSGALAPKSPKAPGKSGEDAGGTGAQPDPQAGSSSGGTGVEPASPGAATGRNPLPPAAPPGVPGCAAGQLGVQASARSPQVDGKVFGSFKVTNVSDKGCSITGPDTVTAAAAPGTATGPAPSVSVVGHRQGDPASGLLTDPSAEAPVLALQPNAAYEVQFAFVPSGESCSATSPEPGGGKPPAKPSAEAGAAAASGAGTASGTDSAADPHTGGGGAPSPEPKGVEVSHTPVPGAPTTQTTIPGACGGTVYRTGAIPLDVPKP
ncbi:MULTISPECIES: hypothetical protein [unclassified Streptomyces]|uniref:hypothetical protein n=1 Tax=unclassified Streptomyces TaxID=2593676 RepID=UPI0022507A60|nr:MULTISPECIES: hypothetical protein [unclassified Streptomyces]MCX4527143.1 hypothetical protein [Streptomyces sp. NBC_01551]MCX4542281.1 hypothetical protein [Streptomyces sp. NBC_01565]